MKKTVFENIKKTAKAVLLILLFVIIYTQSHSVLRDKSESEALGKILKMPDNSYEVVLAGSSHMQYGVQPYILEEEFNIRACNASTGAQSIPTTYYVVKEMAQHHDIKVVAVDLFCLFYPEVYFTPTRFHQAVDNFPMGKNKVDAIVDLAEGNEAEFFLDYSLYHGRWKSLSRYDYVIHDEFDEKKQIIDMTTEFENDFAPLDKSQKGEIPAIALEYLERLVDFCKEEDIKLILTVLPYRADVDNNDVTSSFQQSVYNSCEELAKEWGVDYINLLYNLQDMGFDFKTDMAEFSHLNQSGSEKVTRYFGNVIKDKLN